MSNKCHKEMDWTGLTGKRRSTTIAATPDDGNSQRKRRRRKKWTVIGDSDSSAEYSMHSQLSSCCMHSMIKVGDKEQCSKGKAKSTRPII